MTNSKNPQDQHTNASATELDESELDSVEGGASFLKLGDIEGKSLKIGDKGARLDSKVSREKIGFATEEIKREGFK